MTVAHRFFFSKEEAKLKKAENLWMNICIYTPDSAKRIDKMYDYDKEKIINALITFPHLGEYSGHRTGSKGSGVNPSAMKNLHSAIEHLKSSPKEYSPRT